MYKFAPTAQDISIVWTASHPFYAGVILHILT
jgi:ribosomal protein L31